MAVDTAPGRDVAHRSGIRAAHPEPIAGTEPAHAVLGPDDRQRTEQATRVEDVRTLAAAGCDSPSMIQMYHCGGISDGGRGGTATTRGSCPFDRDFHLHPVRVASLAETGDESRGELQIAIAGLAVQHRERTLVADGAQMREPVPVAPQEAVLALLAGDQ